MMNWIDGVIIAGAAFALFTGWRRGFVLLLGSLFSLVGSFWLATTFHAPVGLFVVEKFALPISWSDIIGYLVVGTISEIGISWIISLLTTKIPKTITQSTMNKSVGSILSLVNALIISAFVLLLITLLPIAGSIKQDIQRSPIAQLLTGIAQKYDDPLRNTIDQATKDAIKFLTIAPDSNERMNFNFPDLESSLAIDSQNEISMIEKVNLERAKVGLVALVPDSMMTLIAREKSADMFMRKYFSHYDLDGNNAADRMNARNVSYGVVGENLAYAPNVIVAHEGLMNSDGHRANILEPGFRRIGIGVIDGGIFGKMFTQIFAD